MEYSYYLGISWGRLPGLRGIYRLLGPGLGCWLIGVGLRIGILSCLYKGERDGGFKRGYW